jgi:6-phosphofructokinase 1
MILEVMGRDAGWIALHTAIAGGAEVCLIPEIPFHIDKIMEKILKRYHKGRGFANIVIAEGAKPAGGEVIGEKAHDIGDPHVKLGGVGNFLRWKLEENNCPAQVRTTILGHVQRGGTPIAFDRILATGMGVKAFEMARDGQFGQMVTFRNNNIESVPITEAISQYKYLDPNHYLIKTARSVGISFGD